MLLQFCCPLLSPCFPAVSVCFLHVTPSARTTKVSKRPSQEVALDGSLLYTPSLRHSSRPCRGLNQSQPCLLFHPSYPSARPPGGVLPSVPQGNECRVIHYVCDSKTFWCKVFQAALAEAAPSAAMIISSGCLKVFVECSGSQGWYKLSN